MSIQKNMVSFDQLAQPHDIKLDKARFDTSSLMLIQM